LAGLQRADAPAKFGKAAAFYATLPQELDALAADAAADERQECAWSGRVWIHRLLDTALDLVETVDAPAGWCWP
jgi:hypothetical protein